MLFELVLVDCSAGLSLLRRLMSAFRSLLPMTLLSTEQLMRHWRRATEGMLARSQTSGGAEKLRMLCDERLTTEVHHTSDWMSVRKW